MENGITGKCEEVCLAVRIGSFGAKKIEKEGIQQRIAAKDFKFIYFSHVRRTGNSVAQHLAKKEKVWLEEMSKDISPFVTHDKVLIQ